MEDSSLSPLAIISQLQQNDVTHVVWLPDSETSFLYEEMQSDPDLELVQVAREGESIGVAMGLWVGGKKPVVLIQNTGLFESGDALRNVLHDYQLPLYGLIGYRSYLNSDRLTGDYCLQFTEPVLEAWNVESIFIDSAEKKDEFKKHYLECQQAGRAGITLLAEGRA